MEDDSNEILTLLAKDELAAYMFNEPHNKDRYHPPECRFDYRESTPSCAGDEESQFSNSFLKLTFDKMPRRAELGFTFGREPTNCDIYLPKKDISRVHFRVTFSPEGRLLLIDTSSHGMWLTFDGQRNYTLRHEFTWILSPDIKTIEVDFGDDHSPRFELKVPRHTNIQAYQENLARFQKVNRDTGPSLSSLVLSSQATTARPSRAMSPRRRPWYLKEGDQDGIGHGQFGVVYKARDISTNELYAIKEFVAPRADTAQERARLGRSWQREIEIMRTLPPHPYTVRFIDSSDEGRLQLVMEYLPRGNLAAEQEYQAITMEECVILLRQALQALVHLHSHGFTHRDIKPDNILVHSRTPFHIKLADFGLSQSSSMLFTFCGTGLYMAPEVAQSQYGYTPVVDIWALGVVVFQFAYGLPSERNFREPRRWASRIIDAANDVESDKLVDFLCMCMLVKDHHRRLSAEECLERASQIPVEDFRLQSSLHQVKDHESPNLIRGSRRESKTAISGLRNKRRARESLKCDPPTVKVAPILSAARFPQPSLFQTKSNQKQRRSDSSVPSIIIKSDLVEMEVNGKKVSMRRSDASFNARHLLSLISENLGQEELLEAFGSIRGFKEEVLKGSDELWLPFSYGQQFCYYLDFTTVLKPLVDYGNGFIACHFDADVVMIRKAGLLINATHIYKIAKESQRCMQLKTKVVIMTGPSEYQGKYCSVLEGLKWCRSQRLIPLITCLRKALNDYGYGQIAVSSASKV